ncbi:TonB-dependent receptor [Lunatimonas lonarensis]|uniref:TonB-dependent receptor n=1 Tax=Lunatimonas lonarensis TaxID=1232681 RepID=R7ZQX1_9BACT|nr:SusC/RagA family TonB-linked outer membrane protein [Lunatimonas lonarensis]EON76453.1 TonB-dependent receptor [Lunatimonas lonarensis]
MKKNLLFTLFFSFLVQLSFAQAVEVRGTIISSEGNEPIPGASVLVKGTTVGSVSDMDGNYTINVPSGSNVLVFSFIGLASQEVEIGGRSIINVTMDPEVSALSEVVVTALGISRERASLGYAVQSVDGERLADTRETNIVNALQGQIAGVQIQGTPGAIGGSSRITIRGVNSFLGENQPLFVVDGMPINNANYATADQQRGFGGGAYDYGNAASDINPEDIASMEVLKGAAATALYGTRGSNGVILITTKSGGTAKRGIGVEVNSTTTFENPIALMPHQQLYGGGDIADTESGFVEFFENGQKFLAPIYAKDGAWGPRYDPNVRVRHWDSWDVDSPTYGETRPWVAPANPYERFFETGVTRQNNLAVSGSNDVGSFRLSYTNLDQAGVIPNSNLSRNTISFNTSYKVTDRLTASAAGSMVIQKADGRNATGYNNANPMQGFTQWWQTQLDVERLKNDRFLDGRQQTWNPIGPVIDPETGQLLSFNHRPRFFDNPYWVRRNYLQEDTRDRFFGNFNLNYKIMDGLSFNFRAMRDGFTFRSREGIPQGGITQSRYREEVRTFAETNLEATLLYDKRLNDKFSLNAMLGGNLMNQLNTRNTINTVGGLALDGFFNIANSVNAAQVITNEQERAINSVFATTSVGFMDMVYVDLALRGDWSSTLPVDNNNYWYPSVSSSFIFTELEALRNSFLSFGKVRVGYGQAANDASPYQLQNVYSNVVPNFGSFPRYTVPLGSPNANLRPERTNEIEFGVEFAVLNNRLSFDVSYYDRTTVDQIFNVPSSASTGFTSRILNAGSMRNHGIEVTMNATPVVKGDFSWDLMVNFATFNNEVVELAPGVQNIIAGTTWAADVRIQEGFPYMSLFGQDFRRNDAGQVIVGANGFPIANSNREFLGSTIADFAGGVRNSFRYKGLELGVLVDYQGGGIIHSTSLQWSKYSGMDPVTVENNVRETGMIVPGVTESGEPNTVVISPQAYYQTIWSVASPNVFDGSFIKLRELSLSYALPNRVISKLPVRDVRLRTFGRNLAILHSNLPYLDPQGVNGAGNVQGLENAQVPTTRSIGFDLSFKF